MLLGNVDALRRYPVKSLAGELLESVEIGENGIPGDRSRRLVVENGHARVGRAYRGKENDRLHLERDVDCAIALARERGVGVSVENGRGYFDAAPISLIFDVWLRALREHVGFEVEVARFRPNLEATAVDGFTLLEDDLVGATLDVGSVRLRVIKPIERCVVPTYDLHGGDAEPRVLRFLAQERAATMGVYCEVLRAGTARRGDSVRLVDR